MRNHAGKRHELNGDYDDLVTENKNKKNTFEGFRCYASYVLCC